MIYSPIQALENHSHVSVSVDLDGDGKKDAFVLGIDHNHDGVPEIIKLDTQTQMPSGAKQTTYSGM